MSLLVFFPWLHLQEDLRFNESYDLISYKLGNAERLSLNPSIDRILRCYKSPRGEEREEFTLLRPANGLGDEWNEGDIVRLFHFRDYLAFSALSEVELFHRYSGHYANNDGFKIVVQKTKPNMDFLGISVLRKDGSALNGVDIDEMQFWEPHHAQAWNPRINVQLVNALLSLEHGKDTPFWLPISLFNQSWIDNGDMRPEIEIVEICSSFEELFRIQGHEHISNAKGFAKALRTELDSGRPATCIPTHWGRNYTGNNKAISLREVWARDFYRLRSIIGHGHEYKNDSCWDLQEHRLLASFILPLVVKNISKKHNFITNSYPSSEDLLNLITKHSQYSDEVRLNAIDHILAQEWPLWEKNKKGITKWETAMEKARREVQWREIKAAIERTAERAE